MKEIKVRFISFWPNFSPHDFFLPFLLKSNPHVNIRLAKFWESHDLEIVSVFPKYLRFKLWVLSGSLYLRYRIKDWLFILFMNLTDRRKKVTKIWFTGENERPPISNFDLFLSFDKTSSLSRNIYFPLWFLFFPGIVNNSINPESQIYGKEYDLNYFSELRVSRTSKRSKFACILTSHAEPVRMRAMEALSTLGSIDQFGSLNSNFVENAEEVLRQYRFVICFENDVYPGYVTEKLFNAWYCETIPIWNGILSGNYVNEEAIINLQKFENLDYLVRHVSHLESHPGLIDEMVSKPLLLKKPSFSLNLFDL